MGKKIFNIISFILLVGFAAAFVFPVAVVLINSFKAKFSINSSPFTLPLGDEFVGFSNYVTGVKSTGFPTALGWSLFITVFSVAIIILCTSMCAWYIVRVKNAFCEILYYSLVFSMIVPFQMVMFTMSKTANVLHLDNPFGIILIYLGFGAGLSVFMFTGFIKTVPLSDTNLYAYCFADIKAHRRYRGNFKRYVDMERLSSALSCNRQGL